MAWGAKMRNGLHSDRKENKTTFITVLFFWFQLWKTRVCPPDVKFCCEHLHFVPLWLMSIEHTYNKEKMNEWMDRRFVGLEMGSHIINVHTIAQNAKTSCYTFSATILQQTIRFSNRIQSTVRSSSHMFASVKQSGKKSQNNQ